MFWLAKNERFAEEYVKDMGVVVRERILQERTHATNIVCIDVLEKMLKEESDYFYEKILRMKPDKMMPFYFKWKDDFPCKRNNNSIYGSKKEPRLNSCSDLANMLRQVFDYKEFSKKQCNWKWNAYRFTERLGVQVCPYCGRQFVNTVIAKGARKKPSDKEVFIIRAELDHYIPKGKFPMFALSFYNLIPSCHFCNSSIKHTRELSVDKHIHPYIKGEADFKFTYEREEKEVSLIFDKDDEEKVKNTCEFFRIKDVYQVHADMAEKYYTEAESFSKSLLEDYQNFLGNKLEREVSKKEILLYKFGISEDTENEIIGKFRNNIVDDIVKMYE